MKFIFIKVRYFLRVQRCAGRSSRETAGRGRGGETETRRDGDAESERAGAVIMNMSSCKGEHDRAIAAAERWAPSAPVASGDAENQAKRAREDCGPVEGPDAKVPRQFEVVDGGIMVGSVSKMRQVQVKKYSNRVLVDIREYYEKDGRMLPGKKGISLTLEQWKALQEMQKDIADAINQLESS